MADVLEKKKAYSPSRSNNAFGLYRICDLHLQQMMISGLVGRGLL